MKRSIWIGLLATTAFLLIVAARLPARWMAGFLPPVISCAQISGTVWAGTCAGLVAQHAPLGDLKWRLQVPALFSGKLASHVELQGPAGSATAQIIATTGGRIDARDLTADFALDSARLPQVPRDLGGRVHAQLAQLGLTNGVVTSIEGRIDVQDLEKRDARVPALGDYQVTFPSGNAASRDGAPVGDIVSIKGPWSLEATLRLTAEPGFEIEGRIAPGPGLPPEVIQEMRYLGNADARGRRPFSLAGAF